MCATSVLATLADYQSAITSETSIISYYTFDRTKANNSLGLHNGTLQGGTSFENGIGGTGRGLLLNGSSRVNLGTVSGFDFSDGTGTVPGGTHWRRICLGQHDVVGRNREFFGSGSQNEQRVAQPA